MRRNLQDGEVGPFCEFMDGIYQVALQFVEEDRIEWEREANGEYSVRSYYAVLAKKRAEYTIQPHERVDNFPCKHMDTSIPFRVDFFAYRRT